MKKTNKNKLDKYYALRKVNKHILLSNSGLTFIGIIISAYISSLLYLVGGYKEIADLEMKFKENIPILQIDTVEYIGLDYSIDTIYPLMKVDIKGYKMRIRITNKSDVKCKLEVNLSDDTLAFEPIIRNKILSHDSSLDNPLHSYFADNVISPNETKWFWFRINLKKHDIQLYDTCYFHFCCLYTNPIGGMYDIYFIQQYQFLYDLNKPIEIPVTLILPERKYKFEMPNIFKINTNMKIAKESFSYGVREIQYIRGLIEKNLVRRTKQNQ